MLRDDTTNQDAGNGRQATVRTMPIIGKAVQF